MGGKSSTSTVHNEPPPQVMAAYTDLLKKANPVAATPYQAYTGGVDGSGFEQNQLSGFQNIGDLAGSSNGDFSAASNALGAAGVPTSASVGQYMSPYISGVVNSTMANMQEQNAQQQQGVLGNAIAQGAMGGNRVGVAQSELARQQNLANQSTIANLYNTGYGQALSAAQADKAANIQAAGEYGNLGQTAMQTNLAQAVSQIGAGTQQQQYNYQQYQNKQSYPFQTLGWLANIVEGAGAGMGGTQTTTQPAGNTGSGILGGLLGLGALFLNRGGAVHDRVKRAQGGVIPYAGSSGIMPMNDNGRPAANDNSGYMPEAATGTAGKSTMPTGVAQPAMQQQDPMLQQGMKSMEGAVQKKYPNGILAGLNTVNLPTTAPIPTPNPMTGEAGLPPKIGDVAAPSSGVLSALSSLFGGFADGGAVRRGYDAGGAVGDDPLLDSIRAFLGNAGSPQPQPLPDQQFNDRAGSATPPPLSDQQFASRIGNGLGGGVVSSPDPGILAQPPANMRNPDPSIDAAPVNAQNSDPGILASPAGGGVAPPLPSRTIKDAPEAASVPAYQPERVSKYSADFNKINDAAGLPAGYLNQTAYIESGFNPNADNGIARGAFQFTGPTAKQYGLSNPFDPIASANAAARLAADNSKFLAGGLGRDPTAGELYLAHQQGAAGALNLLTHPDAPATDIVGRAAVVQNGGSPDMTAAQFANLWTSRFNAVSPNSSSDATVLRMADNGAPGNAQGNQSNGILVGPQPSDDARGVLSSILHGERPHISDDMRMALLSAGLGMMASKSPNMLTGIGEGGMQGIGTYMEKQRLNRENAQAQSEIANRTGTLGLEGKRVDLAGQDLALKAKTVAADIGQTTANTAKTAQEVQAGRYQVTQGPAGYVVRDVTNPLAPPKVITWDQVFNQGDAAPADASGAPGGAGGSAPTPAAPAGGAAPDAPVKAAPVAPVGPVPTGVFANHAPARVPIDPRLFSSPDLVKNEANDGLKEARAGYQGAVNTQTQLSEMQHDLGQIQNSAWTSPGTGFESRVKWARAVNTGFNALGIEPPIDEAAVASGENLNKLTTRLGFSLSSSLGSGEAANIVNQAVASVPGGANSKEGAARIIAGLQAANQRKTDYYAFLQDWSAKGYGSIKGADEAFNRQNPPELYAIASYVPSGAIQALRSDPSLAPQFEQKYGLGTSKYVLGQQ
jgi:hypothetical protein